MKNGFWLGLYANSVITITKVLKKLIFYVIIIYNIKNDNK